MYLNLFENFPGRSVAKKGYIGPVSTKTHSGDPDGTGGFGGFLGSGRSLALKFGFYKKYHRQNWLEIVGKQKYAKNMTVYKNSGPILRRNRTCNEKRLCTRVTL